MKLEIDNKVMNGLVECNLKQTYKLVCEEINELKKIKRKTKIQIEDLTYYRKVKSGMQIVLGYYGIHIP